MGDRICNYTLKFMSLSYKKLNKKQTKQTKIQNKAKQKKTKTENWTKQKLIKKQQIIRAQHIFDLLPHMQMKIVTKKLTTNSR